MRIIRLKLKPAVKEHLALTCQRYAIEDPGFGEDMFALFRYKGSGLPSDERIVKLAKVYSKKNANLSESLVTLHMRKRKHVLEELASMVVFKSLCLECATAPHIAVQRILQMFREFTLKRRQASCMTCSLQKNCAFGKQYGDQVTDISKVIDPDFKKLVDPNCPDLPNIETVNSMYEEMQKLQQINPNTAQGAILAALTQGGAGFMKALEEAESEFEGDSEFKANEDADEEEDLDPEEAMEDADQFNMGGGAGKGGNAKGGSHTGRSFAQINEQFVNRLSAAHMQLYEVGRQLDQMLGHALQGKFKPTKEISKRRKQKRLTETSEVAHADPSQHAMDDDAFDAKLGRKELTVQAHEKPEEKKQLLYGLTDVSGSMGAPACPGNPHFFLTRAQVAGTLAGALCKRVGDDGGMLFMRWFSDQPGDLRAARKSYEFPALLRDIVRCDSNGGGTSIITALRVAHHDITSAQDEIAKAEVLLNTDMDDNISDVDEAWIVQAFDPEKGVKLNVLDINSSPRPYGNAHVVLKRIAHKYLKIDAKTLKLDDLVALVK